MSRIKEKTVQTDGGTIHLLSSKKFKTISIVAKFRSPLVKETISKRALLPYLVKKGTKDYPTSHELQVKLDELYGATLTIYGSKIGEMHVISTRLEIPNERYIPNESNLFHDAIKLFHELLFDPAFLSESFSDTVFNREKKTLLQKIASTMDNKMSYANQRLVDEMCEGEPYALHVSGYKTDIDTLKLTEMRDYYNSLLVEDPMDLYILGDFEEKQVLDALEPLKQQKNKKNAAFVSVTSEAVIPDHPKELIEKQNMQQAKLHIGYRTNIFYNDSDYFALQVFNGLFGGFASSLLFKNVREKHSLAYYAASRLESHKGIMMVMSGIDYKNFEKTRDIIRLQLQAIKDGKFSEDDLKEVKIQLINQLKEAMDHPDGIIAFFNQQAIGNQTVSIEQYMEALEAATSEDVVRVANNIHEDTVFLLTSKEDAQHA